MEIHVALESFDVEGLLSETADFHIRIRGDADHLSTCLRTLQEVEERFGQLEHYTKELRPLTSKDQAAISEMRSRSRRHKMTLKEAKEQSLRNAISSVRSLPGATAQEKREMIAMVRADPMWSTQGL